MATGIEETGENVLGHAGGLTAFERHENDLEAAQRSPIPGAVLGDEGTAGKALRQELALVECKAERCGVRAERVIRDDGLRYEVRPLRLGPRIEVLPEIAVRPTVKSAILDRRHVVRDEVATEEITLIDRRP